MQINIYCNLTENPIILHTCVFPLVNIYLVQLGEAVEIKIQHWQSKKNENM